MAVAVIGHFRIPPDRLEEARPAMARVIEATRAEPGCISYSYALDVAVPGLVRVSELWESREHLAAHFESEHMIQWISERQALDVFDRQITAYALGPAEPL